MNSSRAAGILLALACAPTFLVAASALDDPLWRKAVVVANSNSHWVPGLMVTRTEILQKGEPASVHEVWQRSSPGTNAAVVRRIVKILEDGKEMTKKEKPPKSDGRKGGSISGISGSHPFDATVQHHVSLQPTPETRVISGKQCVAYDFELRNTTGPLVKGRTWLEKETGWPAEIENMTFNPMPDKRFKRLWITTRYEAGPEGRWQIKEIIASGTLNTRALAGCFPTPLYSINTPL